MKKILLASLAIAAFAQCSEEEIVPMQREAAVTQPAAVVAPAAGSMTISGVYTSYEEIKDCKTCTFVVPADMQEVDGLELKLKPGAVICLNKSVKYGDITFRNLEGTESSPITIGTVEVK